MIDYNKEFNEEVDEATQAAINATQANPDTAEPDYKQWAVQLRALADQVQGDSNLNEDAHTMADLADDLTTVIPQLRAESSAGSPLNTDQPQALQEFSRIGQEFDDTLIALDKACPA